MSLFESWWDICSQGNQMWLLLEVPREKKLTVIFTGIQSGLWAPGRESLLFFTLILICQSSFQRERSVWQNWSHQYTCYHQAQKQEQLGQRVCCWVRDRCSWHKRHFFGVRCPSQLRWLVAAGKWTCFHHFLCVLFLRWGENRQKKQIYSIYITMPFWIMQ